MNEELVFTKKDIEDIQVLMESPEGLEELEEVVNNRESFPYTIMMFAVSKDMTDTVTGGLGSFLSTPIASIVIFAWVMGKGSFMSKRLRKFAIKRFLLWFVAKFFPLVNMVPLTSLFVYSVYARETKIIQGLDLILKTMHERRPVDMEELIEIAYA